MALPDGDWDIITFDGQIPGDDPADQGWTVQGSGSMTWPGGLATITCNPYSPDPFALGQAYLFMEPSPGCQTFAVSFRIANINSLQQCAIAASFNTTGVAYILPREDGFDYYDAVLGAVSIVNTNLTDGQHIIYVNYIAPDQWTINIDGIPYGPFPEYPLPDYGHVIVTLSNTEEGAPTVWEVDWAVASTSLITPGGGGSTYGEAAITVGSDDIQFELDEWALYAQPLTLDQALRHYQAGKGLPTT